MLGFPAVWSSAVCYPVEQFPLPILQYVWTQFSTQHLHPLQGAMASPGSIHHLWKALDINLSIGRACGEFVALRAKYGRTLLKAPSKT